MPWATEPVFHPAFHNLVREHSLYYFIQSAQGRDTSLSDWSLTSAEYSEIRQELESRKLAIDLEIYDHTQKKICFLAKKTEFDLELEKLLHRAVLGQNIPLGSMESRFAELDDALVVDIGDEFLFSYLISLVQKKLNAEVGLLQVFSDNNVLNMSMGFSASDLDQIIYQGQSLRSFLEEQREPVVFPDTDSTPELIIKNRNPGQIKTILAAPVINKGKMVALICLVNKITPSDPPFFTEKDRLLLSSMSVSIGTSITNALLYQETTELKEFNEQVLENMPAGILTLSSQREILFINRYLREMLEKTGLDHADLFRIMEKGEEQEFFNREFFLDQSDPRLYLRISKRFLQVGVRQPVYLYTISDISLEKEFELQMRRTERLAVAGELIAGIAHEIKNPLTSMKGFTDLLWSRIDDREFVLKFASIVGSEINRLNTIIERFQSFARPQIGEMAETELSTLVREMSDIVSFNLERHHIRLDNQVRPGIKIYGTRDLILQVLINIMLNASQALMEVEQDEKFIRLSLNVKKKLVELLIEDNGPGIPEKELARIFDPFYTTKPKGSGLGLSISHRIMQEHNGSINIESREGQYTRVILSFPLDHVKEVK